MVGVRNYQAIRAGTLGGLRLMEDITYPDSRTHEILALNDGSYIVLEDGTETLYGEARRIQNGRLEVICKDGEALRLKA